MTLSSTDVNNVIVDMSFNSPMNAPNNRKVLHNHTPKA